MALGGVQIDIGGCPRRHGRRSGWATMSSMTVLLLLGIEGVIGIPFRAWSRSPRESGGFGGAQGLTYVGLLTRFGEAEKGRNM